MAYEFESEEWHQAYDSRLKERLAMEQKPYVLGTPEWVHSYQLALQTDPTYPEATKGWKSPMVIHILAEPNIGIDQDIYIYLDIGFGVCKSVRIVPKKYAEQAKFMLTGEYKHWKAVIKNELGPVKSVMQRKLKLKGDMPTFLKQVQAAIKHVDIATAVASRFPDELSAVELEKFKSSIQKLRSEFGV